MAAMTTSSAPTQHAAAATTARAGRPSAAPQPAGDADLFARMLQGTDAASAADDSRSTADRAANDVAPAESANAEGARAEVPADPAATADAQSAGAAGDAAALAQWLQQMGLMVPTPPASAASAVSAKGGARTDQEAAPGQSTRGTLGGQAADGVALADLPGLAVGAAGLQHQVAGLGLRKGALPSSPSRPGADQPGMPAAADQAARAGTNATQSLADSPRGGSAAQPVSDATTSSTRATELAGRRDFAALLGDASAAAGQLAQQGLAPPTAWAQASAGGTAPVSQPVAVPVDDPNFGGVMMSQVVNLARDGVQQAELHLNPAGMGPIVVQIAISQDQARIQFEAAHAGTRALIEQSLPTLAQSLRDDGLQLAASSVVAPPNAAQDLGASAQGGQSDPSGQRWAAQAGADGGAPGGDSGRRSSQAGGARRGMGTLAGVGALAGSAARPPAARIQPAGRLDLYA
jgi:flagellar hook-length control protein FliK